MNRNARRATMLALSVIVCCIVFCGIASAATIQSPLDGETFSVNESIKISVKTGYSSNRDDYAFIRVYDENNKLVFYKGDILYDGIDTIIKETFIPTETGKYTITAGTHLNDTFKSPTGRTSEITINVVDKGAITSNKPDVIAKANGSGKVYLTIDGKGSKFTVYRSTSKNGTYSQIGTTKSSTYTDKTVGQKIYYYKVKGSGVLAGKTYHTKYSSIVKVNAKITAFKADISVTLEGDNTLIKVNNKPKAAGYRYYRATTIDGNYKLLKTTSKAIFIDSTAGDGTYFYKVRPYAIVNNRKIDGKYSKPFKLAANNPNKPSKPEITVTQGYFEDGKTDSGLFHVNFYKVENADTYRLYISKDGGKTYTFDDRWYLLDASNITNDYIEWAMREEAGITYYIKLSASSKNFQEGTYEAFSEPVKFTLQ